ncbi:MAG: polymer-forming cytoskeletal protein [Campylobacterota bacterium]|nr:polymer-forming cytoskeletal protein [Campylobacterota bacterium]
MGIFSKSNKKSKSGNGTTIIGKGTTIKGGIDTEGSIFIDGRFEGVIVAQKSVTIGKTGEVLGEIKTKDLIVNGLVDGMFDIKNITILETGKVIGKMQYEELIIEKNGIFDGIGKQKNSKLNSQYSKLEIKKKNKIEE